MTEAAYEEFKLEDGLDKVKVKLGVISCDTRVAGRSPRFPSSIVSHPQRRKLGQHFLTNPHFRRRIADAIDLRREDLTVEIGAGRGAMTGLLAERARRVVAVELDPRLVDHLNGTFGDNPSVEILAGDILSTDVAAICGSRNFPKCFVFGNVPYYITSPILEHLAHSRTSIRAMALLVQREVADRIIAAPGSRDYGYLSVFVQSFTRPRLLFNVPPGAFSPPPKIQSALVAFSVEPRFPEWNAERESTFLEFVKRCFAQKRKNIVNNLVSMAPRTLVSRTLDELHLPAKVRAEEMALEQLAELYLRLERQRSQPGGHVRLRPPADMLG